MNILSTPSVYSSVHDDLIYTVYDAHAADSATFPNYKYIGDVYVGATLVARLKKVQDPTTGIGIFNIGQIVRNYLATTFNPTGGVLRAQTLADGQFKIAVIMKFGEEYSYTATLNIVADSARTFFNNYNGRLLGTTSSLSSKTDAFASNNPLRGQVTFASNFYLVPYFPTTVEAVTVTVTPTGGGSALLTSFTPLTIFDLQVLNLSPQALNAIASGTITSNTKSYTVTIGGLVYRIEIVCEPIYTTYMVHFLNRYGGFESKLFNKVSRKTFDVTKKDFGKLPYTVDGAGVPTYKNANGVYNESRSVYSSQFKEKMVLNTDLLTDGEYQWLADLIISPMVYLEEAGYFFPVVLSENTYDFRKVINDDLSNLTISLEFGNQLNAQYR